MDRISAAVEQAVAGEAGSSELAGAKLNLALHVTGRRSDGYHTIETLVVFADYADVVSAVPSPDRMRLTVKGPFAAALAEAGDPASNLAIRAATELARAAGAKNLPAMKLVLTKRIPVAAGLGGGSADAAATLRLLNREWNLKLGEAALAEIGLRLGADVPMCLASRPLVATGIGEMITPVAAMPSLPIVMAHPCVPVSTTAVFARLEEVERSALPPLPPRFGSLLDVIFWLRRSRNDLADAAAGVAKPATAAARALISDPECLFSRMSGSGAAAFGIFTTMDAAERAAARLRANKPAWWVASAMTTPS